MKQEKKPRILIVTPEATYLPDHLGSISDCLSAKAGGLADVAASLICELFRQGVDVHATIPNYKAMYEECLAVHLQKNQKNMRYVLTGDRLHLAEDRIFFHRDRIYSGNGDDNLSLALVFQREVINNIIPRVAPDLIHCHDWMIGLIPAMARKTGIPCLFTVHNIHSMKTTLNVIEERGIDVASFWDGLYYERRPQGYEESRYGNSVELLTCGVFAANYVNTVSPTFLKEMVSGRHAFVNPPLRQELANKLDAGCAFGILNAPNATFDPATDAAIARTYSPETHPSAKRENKTALQIKLGLNQDANAPVFFWPSRLDPTQKGCQLLAEVLFPVVSSHGRHGLQILFIADGPYRQVFQEISAIHDLKRVVDVHPYDEKLEHLAYAGADFVLMPSKFEPCGLSQMIGQIYGTLPVVHKTGGLRDTVSHLNVDTGSGNGFVFESFDSNGLFWAMGQAMMFFMLAEQVKQKNIERIMRRSVETFNYRVTADAYFELYRQMLGTPAV